MKIALTGATGFVGRSVLPLLLAEGHQVTALVRGAGRLSSHRNLIEVNGALDDEASLQMLTHEADAMLHLAGAISGLKRADYFKANVEGTRLLARAAGVNRVKHFVHMSSLAARQPALSDYAASKHVAEAVLKDDGFAGEVTILRAAAVYGEGDVATLPLLKALMSPIAFIPGSKLQRFSLVHVADLAKICMAALIDKPRGVVEVDDGSGGYCWPDMLAVTRQDFDRPRKAFYIPSIVAQTFGSGADIWSGFSRTAGMVSAGKMRELYYPDWTVKPAQWPKFTRLNLGQALPKTIRWYQQQGLLPAVPEVDTNGANQGTPKT